MAEIPDDVVERACRQFGAVLSAKGWGGAPIGDIDSADLEEAMKAAITASMPHWRKVFARVADKEADKARNSNRFDIELGALRVRDAIRSTGEQQ